MASFSNKEIPSAMVLGLRHYPPQASVNPLRYYEFPPTINESRNISLATKKFPTLSGLIVDTLSSPSVNVIILSNTSGYYFLIFSKCLPAASIQSHNLVEPRGLHNLMISLNYKNNSVKSHFSSILSSK